MNFRKVIYVCIFILVIFTIGAVCASEDVQSVDELDNCSCDDEVLASGENPDYIIIEDEYDISHDNDSFCDVKDDEGINGTVTVEFDNCTVYNKTFNGTDRKISFNASNVEGFKLGKVNVTVNYNKINLEKPVISTKIVDFSYPFSFARADDSDIYYGDKIKFNIVLPCDVTNKVSIIINGKTYRYTLRNGKANIHVPTSDLKIQNYTVYATYGDVKYPINTLNTTVSIFPKITFPNEISVGENQKINVIVGKQTGGNVILYSCNGEHGKGDIITRVFIVDGQANIPLNKLPKGDHELYLEYSNGAYIFNKTLNISFIQNTPGIKASLSASEISSGSKVIVSFSGVKSDERVYIYVDGNEYTSSILSSGRISEDIIGLTVGSHNIRVYFKDADKFYSQTFLIKVKPAPVQKEKVVISLTLKKVKVKKSAKKLVLKASLKINHKVKKGLKVSFKFNGKKYSSKTNKKGVAKITIKKKVLKKLKVGKKVKYQVSYKNKTVKKSVKVKK